MKIFDFSNGIKGKLLDNKKIDSCGSNGGFKFDFGRYEYHQSCGIGNSDIKPSDYGVKAICFCLGEMKIGIDTFWYWNCVGSIDWAKKYAYSFRQISA